MGNPNECPGSLNANQVESYKKAFESNPNYRAMMNAVTKTSVKAVAMNRRAVTRSNHTYSNMVKTGPATSQNGSGRCWMFAGLNLFRTTAAEKMTMEEFEISQAYTFFWDKIERANYYFETILETLDEPTDGRLVAWIVANPIQDGGQWDMFANLIKKYGVVPKEVMPESESSSSTGMMNDRITEKLREYGVRLRVDYRKGATIDSLRARKEEMMATVYRMLCIHMGEPPTDFLWQWRDKDKNFHRDGVLTPREFYDKYVGIDLDSMVCLINCSTEATPYNKVYTIEYLGNVVGGSIVRYVNVTSEEMKTAAVAQIRDGKPVWFGCDVGKMFDRDLGLMDDELFNYSAVYDVPFGLTKAERLDYGASAMNHAMVLSGVDLDDNGKPRKWRVENSWGDKGGDKGFMSMTDSWFDEYNYEVVVEKKYLPESILKVLEQEPIKLPPWHPMGALAG